MNKFEFDLLIINNLDGFFIYLFLNGLIVFFILRKHIYSIFDPLAFGMILSICAYSTVFFSYHFNLINHYYFFSFVLTQSLFFFGFLMNAPIKQRDFTMNYSMNKNNEITPAFFIYMISSILYIISQLIVYYVSGIPLFMESRLETFTGGSGYGILGRIIYVTSIVSLSFATYRLLFKKNNIFANFYDYIIIFFSIVVAVLSGSKAGILLLIFIIFLTVFFARKSFFNPKIEKKFQKISISLLIILFPVTFLTLFIQLGFDNLNEILISLLLRFVHTGDIFFMAYPNDVLAYLNTNENGFFALFRSILGALRIVSWENLPTNLGLQVFWYHYDTDLVTGPNARHNVFGLFYFGFMGSLLFSFFLGYIYSFIRNKLYKLLKYKESNVILYTLLVMSINYIGQDPSGQTVDYLFSILLIFPPIYFISLMMFQLSKKRKNKNEKNIFNPCIL